jgi:hypothetical protein
MTTAIIDEVVEQLRLMPQVLQQRVLDFVQTLAVNKVQGTPGQQLLCFAGSIPIDDLHLMQRAIEQDCGQVDRDEW